MFNRNLKYKYKDIINFRKNFTRIVKYIENSHFLGSKTLTDYYYGNRIKKEIIIVLTKVLLFFILSFRSLLITIFKHNNIILLILGDISHSVSNPLYPNIFYSLMFSSLSIQIILILSDRNYIQQDPIIAEIYTTISHLDSNCVLKDKYFKKVCTALLFIKYNYLFMSNISIIYILIYGFVAIYVCHNDHIINNEYGIICIIFWCILHSIGFYYCVRIFVSVSCMLLINILYIKFRFHQIRDDITDVLNRVFYRNSKKSLQPRPSIDSVFRIFNFRSINKFTSMYLI
jgi:hypothetical protein